MAEGCGLPGGMHDWEGVCAQGMCVPGGRVWPGACMAGHVPPCPHPRHHEIRLRNARRGTHPTGMPYC